MVRDPQPADVIDGCFEITEEIARSGMAAVYKAVERGTGRAVALKIPFFQYESDPAFHSRFQREERIGLALDHPAIVKMLPVKAPKSRPYVVMEYLEGTTLDCAPRYAHPVDVDTALDFGVRLCDALDYLHSRNVIHRDLKPQNVMVGPDGSLRLFDFGIAKAAALPRLTFGRFSATIGTPDYMAPEQVRGGRGDARTDVYSLGAMLYEMLTGRPPFVGDDYHAVMNARLHADPPPLRALNPAIPATVEEIVLRALEREPERRYPTAAAFRCDLEDPQAVAVTDRAERLRAPVVRSPWRNRRPLLLAVGTPLAAALLAALIALLARR